MNSVPITTACGYGFRAQPFGLPRNDEDWGLWRKANFASRIKPICFVSHFILKILLFRSTNRVYLRSHPAPSEGRMRYRHETWRGMRWTQMRCRTSNANADDKAVWS